MKTKTDNTEIDQSSDYKDLIDLLAVFSEADNRIKAMEGETNSEYMTWVDEHKKDFAEIQEAMAKAEAAAIALAEKHPEWFKTKKTVKTLYGEVKSVTATSLVIDDPEKTMLRIKLEFQKENAQIAEGKLAPENARFAGRNLIRVTEEPNLEALKNYDDATLAVLAVRREVKESITIKPVKIDLGKAVADAVEKKEAT